MKRRNEVLVGFSILLGLAVVVFGTLWLKGASLGREDLVVQSRFREVGQLQRGNPVKLRGVTIGRVEEFGLEPEGNGVIVTMRIDRDAPLPADAVVLLAPGSLFGEWQAQILPRSRFPRYAYAESPDPTVLPGFSLPDMSQLTAVADRIAENLAVLTERVEIAFTEETALNVRRAIENIQEVSEQLTGLVDSQQRAIDEVANNLQTTTESLGQAAEAVRRAFLQVDAAIADGRLESIVGHVHRTTAQIDSISDILLEATNEFRSTVGSADRTFRSVDAIAESLRDGEGTLGRLVRDTALYNELVQTNELFQQFLLDIRANPRKYINLRIF